MITITILITTKIMITIMITITITITIMITIVIMTMIVIIIIIIIIVTIIIKYTKSGTPGSFKLKALLYRTKGKIYRSLDENSEGYKYLGISR